MVLNGIKKMQLWQSYLGQSPRPWNVTELYWNTTAKGSALYCTGKQKH